MAHLPASWRRPRLPCSCQGVCRAGSGPGTASPGGGRPMSGTYTEVVPTKRLVKGTNVPGRDEPALSGCLRGVSVGLVETRRSGGVGSDLLFLIMGEGAADAMGYASPCAQPCEPTSRADPANTFANSNPGQPRTTLDEPGQRATPDPSWAGVPGSAWTAVDDRDRSSNPMPSTAELSRLVSRLCRSGGHRTT